MRPETEAVGEPTAKALRIAVLRALQVGDLLCAVPALRALRGAYPRARITLIGLPWARSFVQRFSAYVDDFAEFPGYPGMPERTPDPQAIPAFFGWARAQRFDLALQLHGSGTLSNRVTAELGARLSAGCYPAGGSCPDPDGYVAYADDLHEIRRCLRVTSFLGCAERGEHLEFPLRDEDHRELAAHPAASRLAARPYVCIHPGARAALKRWPPERFAEVADRLAERGLQVVITGSAVEQAVARAVIEAMKRPALDLACDMSLGALAAVIAGARMLVANDTAVSHLASALRVPSVIVFTSADPARWAPLDAALHRAVWHPVECRPCSYQTCPVGRPCVLGVPAQRVVNEALALLEAHPWNRSAS